MVPCNDRRERKHRSGDWRTHRPTAQMSSGPIDASECPAHAMGSCFRRNDTGDGAPTPAQPTLPITSLSVVMAGPDPAIHLRLRDRMDPRVRPGDDMVG